MIAHRDILVPPTGDFPAIVSVEQAIIDCGCMAIVGARIDNRETAVAAVPCTDAHVPMMRRFYEMMGDSLENPQDRLLIEVVEEFLTTVAREERDDDGVDAAR